MAKQYKNYVNGEWKTSENSITIYAPANGEELGSVPAMSQAEVDEVYAAAKAALPAWRELSYAERAAYLHKAADILERDAEKIGQVLSKEISKGLKSAIGEVVRTAEIIQWIRTGGSMSMRTTASIRWWRWLPRCSARRWAAGTSFTCATPPLSPW